MASDLKMEILACMAFYDLWVPMKKAKGKLAIPLIFGEEIYKVENVYEVFYDFSTPVWCHQKFTSTYWDESEEEKLNSLTSLSECYDYIVSACDRIELLLYNTSVFERIFATLGFVRELCMLGFPENINAVDYGHLLWVMYFEKFTKEFYEEGGWHRLKEEAKPYRNILQLLQLFGDEEEIFLEYKVSVKNYFDFKNSVQYCEYKSKQKKINVSKQWIKFRREQLKDYVPNQSSDYLDAGEMEDLILDLKNIFEAKNDDCSFFTKLKCVEIPTHLAKSTINTNDDEGIQHLSERKCKTKNTSSQMYENISNDKLPSVNITDTKTCFENERINDNGEVHANKTLKTNSESKNRNGWRKNGDRQMETDKRTRIPCTSQMSKSELNGSSFSPILPSKEFINTFIDGLYSENSEKRETLSTPKVLSTIPMAEPERDAKTSPDIQSSPKNLNPENEVNKTLKVAHYSKNGDNQTETDKKTRIPCTGQMTKSELNGSSFSPILPTKEFIDTYIDGLYSENSEKRETLSTPKVLSTIPISESKRNAKLTPDILPTPLDGIFSTGKVKGQIKAINDEDVLSTHRNGESGWPKRISEENLPNPKNFCSENDTVKIQNVRICSDNAKYEETYNENTELTCESNTNKIARVQGKNEIPKNLSSPKAFLVMDNFTKKNDIKLNTNKELGKLREEQKDPEIRSFLKMILVLGDKIGTQHVYRTFRSKEGTTNSHNESNNKKGRSKKKSKN